MRIKGQGITFSLCGGEPKDSELRQKTHDRVIEVMEKTLLEAKQSGQWAHKPEAIVPIMNAISCCLVECVSTIVKDAELEFDCVALSEEIHAVIQKHLDTAFRPYHANN